MSSISAGTTTTTGYVVSSDTTGALVLKTGASGTTALTIDTSQNVGIGTGSPSARLHVVSGFAPSSGGAVAKISTDSGNTATLNFYAYGSTYSGGSDFGLGANGINMNAPAGFAVASGGANPLVFATNTTTERARISSTGNFGIGNTSPAAKLDVVGGGLYDGNFYLTAQFRDQATAAEKGILLGYNNANTSSILAPGYANGTGALAFWTQNNVSWGERARIDAAGALLVNTTSKSWGTTTKFAVAGSATNGAAFLDFQTTSANGTFNWVSTAFAGNLAAGNNLVHFIGYGAGQNNAAWFGYKHAGSNSTSNILTMGLYGVDNVLNVNGNANVSLYGATTTANGVGITFPSTQSASSNANCLDDYEEGTWTPVITGSGGGTLTYTHNSGVYRKVGSMVYIQFGVLVASRSGGSGEILIDGLPFTSISRGGYQEPANALQSGGWTTPAYAGAMYVFVMNSMTQMRTRAQNNADTPGEFTSIQAGTYLNCIMVYCAA